MHFFSSISSLLLIGSLGLAAATPTRDYDYRPRCKKSGLELTFQQPCTPCVKLDNIVCGGNKHHLIDLQCRAIHYHHKQIWIPIHDPHKCDSYYSSYDKREAEAEPEAVADADAVPEPEAEPEAEPADIEARSAEPEAAPEAVPGRDRFCPSHLKLTFQDVCTPCGTPDNFVCGFDKHGGLLDLVCRVFRIKHKKEIKIWVPRYGGHNCHF